MRTLPNVLVAGTPGTGKTSLVKMIFDGAKLSPGYQHINVGDFAKANHCYGEFDENYDCHVMDEDKLLKKLEPILEEGGVILDYHGCDLFPTELVDCVYVLRTNNTNLYDRLAERGYKGKKFEENLQCEIFQTILDEANEAFDEVIELQSNTDEDTVSNCEAIINWIQKWEDANDE